jgi:hypothetical protein
MGRKKAAAATYVYWVSYWTPMGPGAAELRFTEPITRSEQLLSTMDSMTSTGGRGQVCIMGFTLLRVDNNTNDQGSMK